MSFSSGRIKFVWMLLYAISIFPSKPTITLIWPVLWYILIILASLYYAKVISSKSEDRSSLPSFPGVEGSSLPSAGDICAGPMYTWIALARKKSAVWLRVNSLRQWQADCGHECLEGVMSVLGSVGTTKPERDSREKVTKCRTMSNLVRGDYFWLMVWGETVYCGQKTWWQ